MAPVIPAQKAAAAAVTDAAASSSGGGGWQAPYVNVFRLCGVEVAGAPVAEAPTATPAAKPGADQRQGAPEGGPAKLGYEKSGCVREKMDAKIGKRVLRITGTIPAVNYIKLPKAKNMCLTGRFCYLQVKLEPPHLFSFHFELGTADGNTARVSVGNILKDAATVGKRKNGTLSLSMGGTTGRWMLLCVDLAAAARAAGGAGYVALRSLQLCATMSVRGVFTSDIKFGIKSLPRDMVMSHALEASAFDTLWLPAEPADLDEAPVLVTPVRRSSAYAAAMGLMAAAPPAPADGSPCSGATFVREPSSRSIRGGKRTAGAGAAAAAVGARLAGCDPAAARAEPLKGAAACAAGELEAAEPHKADEEEVEGDPFMQLERVVGYTGEFTGTLLWSQSTDEIVFTAASLIVAMPASCGAATPGSPTGGASSSPGKRHARRGDPSPEDDTAWGSDSGGWAAAADAGGAARQRRRQRLFVGHTAYVVCLSLGGDGRLLASGQEGRQPVVRLWDFGSGECLAILCAHSAHLTALDVSPDGGALLAVGQDRHARQLMALWDVGGVSRDEPVAPLLAKCVTDYNVRTASFCPFEPDAFMTAGRDSIRSWRLAKGGRVRGMSVRRTGGAGPLGRAGGGGTEAVIGGTAAPGAAAGPNIFTAIAYECGPAAAQVARRYAFVASAAGTVFQVDYDRCCVLAVFQAHSGAVNALALGEGVAVTAGDDRLLRVWPLDFRSYLLEAEHDAPASAAALSPCGLRVAVGCEDGTLGVLDLGARHYATAVRSHCGCVNAAAAHPDRPEYATVSSDSTVRIWDAAPGGAGRQLYEFRVTGDGAATAVAYHPIRYELAVGYESGAVRVFDVATTRVLRDARQHAGPVAGLLVGPEGARLLSCGADGAVVVCDAARGYQLVRVLPGDDTSQGRAPPGPAAAALSPDGATLVITSGPRRRPRAAAAGPGADAAGGAAAAATAAAAAGSCLLVFDAELLEPRLCIETQAEGFSRLLFSRDGGSLWGLTTAGDVLRFHPATGRLAQRIAAPHRGGCDALALAPGSHGIITGGADRIVKVWAAEAGGAEGGQPAAAVEERPPAHQSFVGHPGAVKDILILGDQLIACGAGDAITLWRLTPGAASGSAPLLDTRPASRLGPWSAAAARGVSGGAGAVADAHPDSNVMMRSWLVDSAGRRRPAWAPRALESGLGEEGDAASGAGSEGRLVQELRGLTVDPGTEPSPLFAVGAHGSPPLAPSPVVASRASAAAAPPLAPPNAAVVGFAAASARCVIWARSEGSVIYASDNIIVVEDLETHRQALLQHHHQPVGSLALSADGALLASAAAAADAPGGAAEVCVWDVRSRALLRLLRHHGAGVGALAFSHDGAWLASASAGARGAESPGLEGASGGGCAGGMDGGGDGGGVMGGSLVLWDLEEGEPVALGRTQGELCGVAWLPHRPLPQLLTAGAEGLLLWTLKPQFLEQRALTLPGAERACVALCTADATGPGGADGRAELAPQLVDGANLHGEWVVPDGGAGGSGDGDTLAERPRAAWAAEASRTVFVADAAGGVWRAELGDGRLARCARGAGLPAGEGATALQWSRQAGVLAVATDQGRVLRYDVSNGGSPGAAAPWQLEGQVMLDGPVAAVSLEPEGLTEGVVATAGCTAWYVSLAEGAAGARVPVVCGHAGQVLLLVAAGPSPQSGGGGGDGGAGPAAPSLVVSVASDGLLRVWQVDSALAVPSVEFESDAPCTAACFAPGPASDDDAADPDAGDGGDPAQQPPLLAAGYADGRLRVFDLRRRAILWSAARHPSPVVALAWHPTQPLLLSASRDGSIAVTHTDTSRLASICHDFTPAVSPLHALAASPGDAGLCAAAWLDRLVVFGAPWRAAQGQRAPVMAEYRCPEVPDSLPLGVESRVVFLPHSPRILLFSSPCLGATALLFDTAANRPLRTLALPAPAAALAAAPCGRYIAFGMENGGVLVADTEGEASAELLGHVRPVRALAFGAGGELVSAAGEAMWVWQPDA